MFNTNLIVIKYNIVRILAPFDLSGERDETASQFQLSSLPQQDVILHVSLYWNDTGNCELERNGGTNQYGTWFNFNASSSVLILSSYSYCM